MKPSSLTRILTFVLERLETEPAAKRVQLCRDLAEFLPDEDESRRLLRIAEDIEVNENRHRQLLLNFRTNLSNPNNRP